VHTASEFVANEIEDVFGSGLRAAVGSWSSAGNPRRQRVVGTATGAGRDPRSSAIPPRDRHAGAAQEPAASRRPFGVLADSHPDLHLVSPATTARPGPRSTNAIARLSGAARRASS
jgi:hypothetical protein